MNARRVVEDIPATPPFDFLYGRYRLSSWVIPYFSTTMSLRDAAKSLRLAADFPGSDDVAWQLDELYQREVDWPRVERRIVPYLRAAGQPQFFNALTIALLPTGHSLSGTEHAFAEDRDWRPPRFTDADRFPKILRVGPITCGYWTAWDDLAQAEARTGQIRWNPEQVFAVALDGQHRLAAIKQFVEHPGISDQQLRATSVPVIFVALDSRFGYETPVSKSLVDVLRVIFIDLNKHAKKPTRARQILLDDTDPTSICVRALVGETVTGDTTDLTGSPSRLPLALVDWHTEQAKCDDGPYVTTILTLDWAITALLGAKPVRNFMDYGAIRKQVVALAQWLSTDMDHVLDRLEDLEAVKFQPFSYSDSPANNELAQIAMAFQQIWNPAFIALLTEFVPYRELIALRRANGSFSMDFANWYRLYRQSNKDPYGGRATDDYKHLLRRLQTGERPVGEGKLQSLLEDIDGHKKAANLAYSVVFQRAYFLACREWLMVDDAHLEDIDTSELVDAFDESGEEEEANGADGPAARGASGKSSSVTHAAPAEEATGGLAAHVGQRAYEFVNCLNTLVDVVPDILQSGYLYGDADGEGQRFWLGTLETAEGQIDFTQSASLRARDVIFWAIAVQMYHVRVGANEGVDFEEFWTDLLDSNGSYMKRIRRSVRRFADKEGSAGGRILKARGEEFDSQSSTEEARARMKWLWTALEL